ncbi:ImmA/IrrE family metallo-endopeptidase [Pimelobacter simplex]|uniref:ImmA/IrrE family metallo-endopeptidase n=1 Tax=Nocardioides simplex TaxID=2045 RepID=UPI0037F9B1DD
MLPRTEPSNLSYNAISAYAERVGERHKIYTDGVADVHRLVRKLGGRVAHSNGDESLRVRSDSDFTVYVPETTSPRRDRFTIAHELGHYFLHYLLPRRHAEELEDEEELRFARGGRNRAETEANVFAASLLMPETEFRKIYRQFDKDAWSTALHFDVSPAAAEVRAQVLAL